MKYIIMLNITNDPQHRGLKGYINKNMTAEFKSTFSFRKGNDIIVKNLSDRIKITDICYIFENMNITETILHCNLFIDNDYNGFEQITKAIELLKSKGFSE